MPHIPLSTAWLHNILKALACERPLFHSEADFQHALAVKLAGGGTGLNIRLEVPFRALRGDKDASDKKRENRALDLLLIDGKKAYVIELKYKTAAFQGKVKGEQFELKPQAAQNHGRYDCLYDLMRIEGLVTNEKVKVTAGWVIMLTNDSSYQKKSGDTTGSREFHLEDGNKIRAGRPLNWVGGVNSGSGAHRPHPIEFERDYTLDWRDYSKPVTDPASKNNAFRYLLIEVPPKP